MSTGTTLQRKIRKSPYVFLSYSHEDIIKATTLRHALEDIGLNVFHDVENIRIGDNWMQKLQDTLQSCSAFILLVGEKRIERWVGAEVDVALNRNLSPLDDNQRLPIYPILLPEADVKRLPPFLARIQHVIWYPETVLPESVTTALSEHRELSTDFVSIVGNPYLGLRSFQRKHADRFFGRSNEALEALQSLGISKDLNPNPEKIDANQSRFNYWLQVHASSGAGKSSLLYAGLLPRIEQGMLWRRTGYQNWKILDPMRPGNKPVEMLAEKLARAWSKHDMAYWMGLLNNPDKPESLSYGLRPLLKIGQAVLLIIDQFEELFTISDRQERSQIDRLLAAVLKDPECPFFLITTIRSDFLDRFEDLPNLQSLYNKLRSDYLLPTISEQGLRELTLYPARLANLELDNGLVESIIRDARDEPGALPLVESALSQLWTEAQKRGSKQFSKSYYEQHNGVVGMLAEQADDLLDSLGTRGKKKGLSLLLALTSINDGGRHTRRRIPMVYALHEVGGSKEGTHIIETLAGKRNRNGGNEITGPLRLIVTGKDKEEYVELVHETLIRSRCTDTEGNPIGYWPTLYNYIFKHRDQEYKNRQLRIYAQHWSGKKGLRKWFSLAGWRDLKTFKSLNPPPNTIENKFLKYSRFMAFVQLGAILSFIAFLSESFYWVQKHEFPIDSMWVQQEYRLISLGLLSEPLPEMIEIPAKPIMIGERDKDFIKKTNDSAHFGSPQALVALKRNYYLSRYEITYSEYDYYIWDQHRLNNNKIKYPTTAKGGRGNRPVVYVSWNEANDYLKWLSKKTGENYRLPTEAEWELGARGNTETAYWWGDDIGKGRASCKGCGSKWDNEQSALVGSFEPNDFGLYDTAGNVWEWTCSGWQLKFDGSENQCIDPNNTSSGRTVRGGSWVYPINTLRSSSRTGLFANTRARDFGFRAAKIN